MNGQPFPCTQCGRLLEPSGTVTLDGVTFPVYQCDTCTVQTTLMGEPVEAAVTFAVNAQGQVFDPASPP